MKGRNFSSVDVRSWKVHTNFSCHIYLPGPQFVRSLLAPRGFSLGTASFPSPQRPCNRCY